MPRYATTKRKSNPRVGRPKRKPFRRTGYGRRAVFKPQRLISTGFPATTMVKLKYVEGFQLDPTFGVATQYKFRANSIYDPNLSSTGHKPMNTDQWALLYKRYTVIGSKITAHLLPGTTSQSFGILFGILLDDDGVISNLAPDALMEQGLFKGKMGNANLVQSSGNGLKVSRTYSAKKFFNVTNVRDNKDLGAYFTANPTRTAKFNILLSPAPGSTTDLSACNIVVTIEYICIFAEPYEQVQS